MFSSLGELGPPDFGGWSPPAAPSPLQKGTKVGVGCCGAEALWGGLEDGQAAGGAAPFLPGALCPPASCRALREGGWFGLGGVGILFLVPHSQAETPSVGREPLVPHQLLEKLPTSSHLLEAPISPSRPSLQCVCSTGTSLLVFFPFWSPFGAFPGSGGVTSDSHMKSEAGALLLPPPSQDSPVPPAAPRVAPCPPGPVHVQA